MAGRTTTPTENADATPSKLHDGDVGTAIKNAQTMIRAKKKVQADLQAARDWLGQSVTLGVCNPEQKEWIEKNLPKRTRKKD